MVKTSRTVVEIRDELHGQIKRLALLNGLRIHELANAVVADFLIDPQRVRAIVKRLSFGTVRVPQITPACYVEAALSFTRFLQQYH